MVVELLSYPYIGYGIVDSGDDKRPCPPIYIAEMNVP